MKLLYTQTNQEFIAEIKAVQKNELIKINKENRFQFDWTKEQTNQVFKIVAKNQKDAQTLGLISLTDIPQELRIHINLLEVAKENIGKAKKIKNIAGCLLAFATQLAFEKAYMGFTSLTPKTALINLYTQKYGFSQYGKQLAIEGKDAIKLIQKYL